MAQTMDHSTNGNVNFAISLLTSFIAWLTTSQVDVYFSIGLKAISIIAGLYAIKNYIESIKYFKSKRSKNE